LKKTSASKNPENYRKLPPNILACKETSTIVQTKKLQNHEFMEETEEIWHLNRILRFLN
jgi:hypothetical protein